MKKAAAQPGIVRQHDVWVVDSSEEDPYLVESVRKRLEVTIADFVVREIGLDFVALYLIRSHGGLSGLKMSHPMSENKIIKKKTKAPMSDTAGNVRNAIERAFRKLRMRDNKSHTRNGRENRVMYPKVVVATSIVMTSATRSRLNIQVPRKSCRCHCLPW